MHLRAFVTHLGNWPAGAGPLYSKLSRGVQSAIQRGTLAPGTRLPAERELARALSISRTTVVTAFTTLQEAGWVESRRGSGTYVATHPQVSSLARPTKPQHPTALFGMLRNETVDAVDMTIGCPFPLKELPKKLFRLSHAEEEALLNERFYYPMGLPTLRKALAEHYGKMKIPTTSDQILVTNGAQQALSLLSAFYVQRGDTVLIEDPTYFGVIDAFRAAGARLSSLPVGDEGVSPSVLRDRLSSAAARLVYLTPTFQNPTGAVMPVSSRQAIAKIASETGTPVIDDCCLADIVLDGRVPPPLAFYGDSEAVITVGCLSKLVWPGLRIGWIRAAENVIEKLARVKAAVDLGSPLITQAIAVNLIDAIPEARKLRREQLLPRRAILVELLKKHLPEWHFEMPSGGFFLWARIPAGDARELAQVAIRHGVAILPGSTMSPSEMRSRYVRLPYLNEPDTLRIAIERVRTAWLAYNSPARQVRETIAMV